MSQTERPMSDKNVYALQGARLVDVRSTVDGISLDFANGLTLTVPQGWQVLRHRPQPVSTPDDLNSDDER